MSIMSSQNKYGVERNDSFLQTEDSVLRDPAPSFRAMTQLSVRESHNYNE